MPKRPSLKLDVSECDQPQKYGEEDGASASKDMEVVRELMSSSSSTGSRPSSSQGGTSATEDWSSLKLSDLTLNEMLGQGASGYVRKATVTATGYVIALKVLNIGDTERRAQLISELKILTTTRSPHLVQYYTGFVSENLVYMALEFLDAGSIEDVVKRAGPMSEPVISVFVRQVLAGLRSLHREQHQVHRDLKPANLLADYKGNVKISDFGLSRDLGDSVGLAGTFVGTAFYMSPERLLGQDYTFSSDVWSLGLIVLECALGRHPYLSTEASAQTNYFELLSHVVNDPPPIPTIADGYSAILIEFVSTCLKKEADQRATVPELLETLFISTFEGIPVDLFGEYVLKGQAQT